MIPRKRNPAANALHRQMVFRVREEITARIKIKISVRFPKRAAAFKCVGGAARVEAFADKIFGRTAFKVSLRVAMAAWLVMVAPLMPSTFLDNTKGALVAWPINWARKFGSWRVNSGVS